MRSASLGYRSDIPGSTAAECSILLQQDDFAADSRCLTGGGHSRAATSDHQDVRHFSHGLIFLPVALESNRGFAASRLRSNCVARPHAPLGIDRKLRWPISLITLMRAKIS